VPDPHSSDRRPVDRGRVVFTAAAAVVAVHVVTDGVLLPEPGEGPLSHPAAVLVPLGVLAAAVAAYPRVRPGLRAAMALVLGALALVGGAAAAAGARAPWSSGAAWTGLALLPAGAALVALGAVLLWRSRRRDGRVVLRRGLLALAGAAVALWLVLPVSLALIATNRPRGEAPAPPAAAHVPVTITTADGLRLAAWYLPGRNGAAVVTLPDRTSSAAHAAMLARRGYGVLMLDMRGRGASEGSPNAYGWGAVADVRAAAAWLRARPEVGDDRVGGLGLSVGGEVLLEAAAADDGIRAVVADGAGERSVRETLLRGPAAALVIPADAVRTAAVAVLADTAPPPALQDVMGRIAPRRVLLVWAGRGAGGEDLGPDYGRAAGQGTTVWEIPEAGHTDGIRARPAEYARRVTGLFDGALRD
jgi:hypothetical protein